MHNCETILAEEMRNKCLTQASQKLLVGQLRDYIFENFSFNPTKGELNDVCSAAVELFASFKETVSVILDLVSIYACVCLCVCVFVFFVN